MLSGCISWFLGGCYHSYSDWRPGIVYDKKSNKYLMGKTRV